MPSAEVSKDEVPSKVDVSVSEKEEHKPSSPREQKAVAGEDAVELSTTKHDITETPNPLNDANENGYPYPEKRASVNVSPPTTQATIVNPSSEASQTRRASEDSSTHGKSIDTSSTKRSSTTDEEGYAGDATWEDRTWKEIVRLKEDMFWARVGGVR